MFVNASKGQNQHLNLDQGQPGLLLSNVLPVLIITMNAKVTGSLIMLLLMSGLLLWKNMASQVVYTNRTGSTLPISKLLKRAIILSSNIGFLSSEMYKEFATRYSLDTDFFFVYRKRCHTASIVTPDNKEETLKMKEKDLIILVIRLMISWEDPMSHFKAQTVRLPDVPMSFMQEADLIEKKMQELRKGLKIIARKANVQVKECEQPTLWNDLPLLMSTDGNVFRQTFHHLCRCLRRDADKVYTFLRVIRGKIKKKRQCKAHIHS
ncbi:prolactin [Cavia porcellus]|uniref:Prolactin n=1 Tax=Cavia porcellus TaxID=10141 RepID=A0A0M6L0L1_CAVPO|nr:prolactin-like [Cavia porcellus]CDW51461.1 TPA: growth hormone C5 [Cavia porcellus]